MSCPLKLTELLRLWVCDEDLGAQRTRVNLRKRTIFTVRRSALHGLCDRNSVRLSVRLSVCLSACHTRGLCPHGSTYDHDFFTIW